MKIVSDDSELLDKIHKEFKIGRIKVKKETKVVDDGGMGDPITTALEILTQIKDTYETIEFYIDGIIDTGIYLKSQIKVELRDGTIISYEVYKNMSEEERRNVFFN